MASMIRTMTFIMHFFGCFCGLGPPLASSASLPDPHDQNGPISNDNRSAANGRPRIRLDGGDSFPAVNSSGYSERNSNGAALSNSVVNPHDFVYIINQPNACQGEIFLAVFVCSKPDNFEQRSAIRATWGSYASGTLRTKILFMLGETHPRNKSIQTRIRKESETHGDIIQEGFLDSYENLTLKSVAILKWMRSYCDHAHYLLKTDDDMYINIPLLIKDLYNSVHQRFIMGEIIAGAEPIRDQKSKWFTPMGLYPKTRYPTYVSGTAYVISGDLIPELYSSALQTELFWIEDVYITGLCAEKAKAMHVSNGKFGYKRRLLSPCLFKVVITGHRMKPAELERIWKEISRPDLYCDYAKIHWNILS